MTEKLRGDPLNSCRTLVIGLDGATLDLIDPLVDAGCLPTLERLMTEGVRSPALSRPAMSSLGEA